MEKASEIGTNFRDPNHPIRKTEFANVFFGHQSAVEKEGEAAGIGSGGNFKEVFKRTFKNVLEKARESGLEGLDQDEDLEMLSDTFLEKLSRIKMEDTIYHDTYSAAFDLFKTADGVILYTTGDPAIQPVKIERSGVMELLGNAKEKSQSSASLRAVISHKKEAEIPNVLRDYVGEHDGEIMVAIYDDSIANFEKAKQFLVEFQAQSGVVVEPLFVFAKRGRVAESANIQVEGEREFETVESLGGLVDLIEEKKNGRKTFVFLDFDGALSDNRLMRVRQAHVAYSNIMPVVAQMVRSKKLDKEQIKNIYTSLSPLWKNA